MALAETSEEKVVWTCERSVIKARSGLLAVLVHIGVYGGGEFSGTQQAETACTALICVAAAGTWGTSFAAAACACSCLLERSTKIATPSLTIASRLSTCPCSCCFDSASTGVTSSPTVADKRLPNDVTLLSAVLGPRTSKQLAADRMVKTGTRRGKEENRRTLRAVLHNDETTCAAAHFLNEI